MADMAALIATFIDPEVKGISDIEARCRKAMKEARGFWMEATEVDRFRAAVAAAIVNSLDASEKNRITKSAKALDAVSSAIAAALRGASVDVVKTISDHSSEDILPLRKWWDEAT